MLGCGGTAGGGGDGVGVSVGGVDRIVVVILVEFGDDIEGWWSKYMFGLVV